MRLGKFCEPGEDVEILRQHGAVVPVKPVNAVLQKPEGGSTLAMAQAFFPASAFHDAPQPADGHESDKQVRGAE